MKQFFSPSISVIVPVYNAGGRLRGCVESLINQTMKDIELIFVLDCPTDGSDLIVKEYAKQYSNIVVIENEKNINTGMSRNKGIDIAKGDYIAFCDHDDMVKTYMYEEMYKFALEKDADIVLGVPEYSYKDNSKNSIFYYPKEGNVKDKLLPLIIGRDDTMPEWEFYFSHGMIWDNIYRIDFIKRHNIRFIDNNYTTFEDNLFLIESLICANKAVVYNKLVYIHTIEDTNTAATFEYVKSCKIISYLEHLDYILVEYGIKETYIKNQLNSVCEYVKDIFRNEIKRNKANILCWVDVLNRLKTNRIIRNNLQKAGIRNYVEKSKNHFIKIIHGIVYLYLTKL